MLATGVAVPESVGKVRGTAPVLVIVTVDPAPLVSIPTPPRIDKIPAAGTAVPESVGNEIAMVPSSEIVRVEVPGLPATLIAPVPTISMLPAPSAPTAPPVLPVRVSKSLGASTKRPCCEIIHLFLKENQECKFSSTTFPVHSFNPKGARSDRSRDFSYINLCSRCEK